jgi:3-ketosteroid 9alpha-monooxygenase subunit A
MGAPRRRGRTVTMADEHFPGYPRGWFVVALSEELAIGQVLPLRYFGRKLVAFRGDDGKARVLDAYCPHLGADLGVGGTVVENSIRCPFHAWRFDGEGRCVEVPYAPKIPPRACIDPWPVDEKNGLIFVWHHPRREPPDYRIPPIAEHGSPEWTGWNARLLEIRTHPKEIVENVADKAHFPTVHGTHVERFDNEFSGHKAIQRTVGLAYPRGGGVDRFSLTATYYGPAYQITEMKSVLENRLLNCHTPIDEHTLHLRFGVMLRISGSAEKTAGFAEAYIENLHQGFAEDIAIWENKQYRSRPLLCDGDGAIGKLRRWYRQFYDPAPADAAVRGGSE